MRIITNIKNAPRTSGRHRDVITQPITDSLTSGMYKGKRCFILGGGPSMKNLDFTLLQTEITIGINKALFKYPVMINYSMDEKFYRWIHNDTTMLKAFKNFTGIRVWVSKKGIVYKKDVYVIRRLREKNTISLDLSSGIWPGNNSGWGALNLAMALGCNPIYLLGYDLKVTNDETHWHNGYEKTNVDDLSRRLRKYKKLFCSVSGAIAELGFTVINLNTESALECFSKQTLQEVLKNSTLS